MAMIFLCHDFYKDLSTFYVNPRTLARLAAPDARRLWDTITNEGLKEGGMKKVQRQVETVSEKLTCEAKEALQNGTVQIKTIKLEE